MVDANEPVSPVALGAVSVSAAMVGDACDVLVSVSPPPSLHGRSLLRAYHILRC